MSAASSTAFNRHDHRRCVADALTRADDRCRQAGARLTAVRRQILEAVWQSHRPVGAYDLIDLLRPTMGTLAPPTIYRALKFLLEAGLVHRIESLNAYIGCEAPERAHDGHFLICERCGTAAEVAAPAIDAAITDQATHHGFRVGRRTVEVAGLCAACTERAHPARDA